MPHRRTAIARRNPDGSGVSTGGVVMFATAAAITGVLVQRYLDKRKQRARPIIPYKDMQIVFVPPKAGDQLWTWLIQRAASELSSGTAEDLPSALRQAGSVLPK